MSQQISELSECLPPTRANRVIGTRYPSTGSVSSDRGEGRGARRFVARFVTGAAVASIVSSVIRWCRVRAVSADRVRRATGEENSACWPLAVRRDSGELADLPADLDGAGVLPGCDGSRRADQGDLQPALILRARNPGLAHMRVTGR
jgi:hypothetical protein